MLLKKLIKFYLFFYVLLSGRLFATLFNPSENLAPVVYASPVELTDDANIVERLLTFYQKSAEAVENRGNSMWQFIFDSQHKNLHQIFMHRDVASTTQILRDPGSSSLFFGIDNLCVQFQKNMFESPNHSYSYALICLDGLLRFAQAIGAAPMVAPETAPYAPQKVYHGDSLLQQIEQELKIILPIPNPYPNEFGTWVPKGAISYRVPQAMYQAWRIKNLLKDIDNPRVLEIGAGVGRTAYYARQFGIQDYTIVDLPMTGMCSGYFLARTLGENQVVFFGEENENASSCVKIIPPESFFDSIENYDLIINADSLTEMDPSVAQTYFNEISKRTKVFLSINHEVNPVTVKNIIDENPYVVHVFRSPYWMREGYVEEVVKFK